MLCRRCELLGQSRLADARLADDEEQPALSRCRCLETLRHAGDLGRTADEWPAVENGSRSVAIVEHAAGRHLVVDALQLQGSDRLEAESLATREQAGHRAAAEDLPRLGTVAETARDDDRRA